MAPRQKRQGGPGDWRRQQVDVGGLAAPRGKTTSQLIIDASTKDHRGRCP
jgi:hypothetical protein